MSGEFVLNAVARGDVGKGASRRLRNDDLVPAIVYGGTKNPSNISVSHRELVKALENEAFFSHLITLKLDGGAEEVILKDLQRHPARPRILHADFQRVSRDRKLHVHIPLRAWVSRYGNPHVHIPLHFINQEKCRGVKDQGGMIQHNAVEVHVSCLPQDLPEFIEVDMLSCEVGDSVHLSDLELPAGVESVELSHGPEHDLPVATVLSPKGGVAEETAS